MKKFNNMAEIQIRRENDERYGRLMVEHHRVTENLIKRLGLIGELDGHAGCVNCLEWNSDGRLLASSSDDVHICIWDAFRKKRLTSIPTGHHGNVFSVKFIPNTGDQHLVSGAADHAVRVHDASLQECFRVCTCHTSRVKRIAVDRSTPNLFWSAGEDALVLQHDMRVSHVCASDAKKPKNVLIDLKSYIGGKAEAKCLSVNPVRSEIMAVGANDPFIRLYDRRMIKLQFCENEDGTMSPDCPEIPTGAMQYFVPGHLPSKLSDYVRKYRSLASTYIEFSPDGTELLANLGGEQIYLFPMRRDLQHNYTTFTIPEIPVGGKSPKREIANGYSNGYRKEVLTDGQNLRFGKSGATVMTLPSHVEKIKSEANDAFEGRKYSRAIQLYNEALLICPNSAILLGNRAAALLKRAWDGDVYVALRDCCDALKLDSSHHKAYLRLCRCLFELSRIDEAVSKLNNFKLVFPEHSSTPASKRLEDDLEKAMKKRESSPSISESSDHSLFSNSTSASAQSATTPLSSTPTRVTRNVFFRFSSGSNDSNSTHSNDSDSVHMNSPPGRGEMSGTGDDSVSVTDPATDASTEKTAKKLPKCHTAEAELQSMAVDFSERYCGHCNTTTDIKEANFFGNYIVAGSDDGSFFIWDRTTTNIVKILRGDESIVNCLQPHPSTCLLATSGIEQVVRLWAPLPEDGVTNDRVITDWNDVASENQKRMNSNPFEVILMNMGYRVHADEDPSDDEGSSNTRGGVQCNQT